MLNPNLKTQSRARPLTEHETALAQALEQVFATGTHDFAAVAAALEQRKQPRPSGQPGGWTADILLSELSAINTNLDRAYQTNGIGP